MFRQASKHCKRVLEAANFHMLITQKNLSLPRNVTVGSFCKLLIVFSAKINLLYLFYSTAWRHSLLPLVKQNCLMKPFLRTLILNAQVSLLPDFPSRTNLKLHNISVTPKMLKNIMNLDLSKAYGLDCIPAVVLKKCEPGLSCIPAELFSVFRKSCFPDRWKVSLIILLPCQFSLCGQ